MEEVDCFSSVVVLADWNNFVAAVVEDFLCDNGFDCGVKVWMFAILEDERNVVTG